MSESSVLEGSYNTHFKILPFLINFFLFLRKKTASIHQSEIVQSLSWGFLISFHDWNSLYPFVLFCFVYYYYYY